MRYILHLFLISFATSAIGADRLSVDIFLGAGGAGGTLRVHGRWQPSGAIAGGFPGISINYVVARRFDIKSDLTYAVNGFRLPENRVAYYESIHLRSIEVPLYLRYNSGTTKRSGTFTISGGPYGGYGTGVKLNSFSGHDPRGVPIITVPVWYYGVGLSASCAATERTSIILSLKQGLRALYSVASPYDVTFTPIQLFAGVSFRLFSIKKRNSTNISNALEPVE
ncbi:MAG: outer membrane beta-barrel protein [Taibaiella sp.]|nr:outer membrane beta-barrel protein [Taibaiella sp.]